MKTERLFNSVVVCTKDRPDDIREFLLSLKSQSVRPDELLIIDASQKEHGNESVARGIFQDDIVAIKYFKTRPNLAYQKNFAVQRLSPKTKVVTFLDDDIVLDPGYMDSILKAFCKYKDVVGITGRISNCEDTNIKFIRKIFFLYSYAQGKILPSSFNVRNLDKLDKPVFIEWMSGGMSSYRKEILDLYKFDEEYSRNGAGREDLDFSYNISRRHKLLFIPNAVLEHKQSKVSRISERQFGCIEVVERYYFIKKNMNTFFNKIIFAWSILGIMSINAFSVFVSPRSAKSKLLRLRGNIKGIASCIFFRKD